MEAQGIHFDFAEELPAHTAYDIGSHVHTTFRHAKAYKLRSEVKQAHLGEN